MQKNIMHDTLSVFDSSFKHQVIVLLMNLCNIVLDHIIIVIACYSQLFLRYPVHNVITCKDEAKSS